MTEEEILDDKGSLLSVCLDEEKAARFLNIAPLTFSILKRLKLAPTPLSDIEGKALYECGELATWQFVRKFAPVEYIESLELALADAEGKISFLSAQGNTKI